jgi:23S rRNA (cytidine2498-2'-O)-methyltransferase
MGVLATLGCEVLAIDRSELDPKIMGMKGVTFRKGNALTLKPKDVGAMDWLFSDVICYPEQLLEMIESWVASGLCHNLVCTIKLKGKTDFEVCQKLAQIPGAHLKHLACNKHELTWWICAAATPQREGLTQTLRPLG